jgi:hypothetical protein
MLKNTNLNININTTSNINTNINTNLFPQHIVIKKMKNKIEIVL